MNELSKELSQLWPPDFLLELALGLEPTQDIMDRYGVTPLQLQQWYEHPVFKKELTELQKRISDEGLSFKLKSRVQAEQYLKEIHKVMTDRATPPNVKLEILRSLAKWAGFEPKEEKNQTQVNVQVNAVGNLINAVKNSSRDLVTIEDKEQRAKSWRE